MTSPCRGTILPSRNANRAAVPLNRRSGGGRRRGARSSGCKACARRLRVGGLRQKSLESVREYEDHPRRLARIFGARRKKSRAEEPENIGEKQRGRESYTADPLSTGSLRFCGSGTLLQQR